jgi:hypothetical protein
MAMARLWNRISSFWDAIREINGKYKTPRIKMTRMVSFWLLMLRLYLIGMLLLLLYKFISIVSGC